MSICFLRSSSLPITGSTFTEVDTLFVLWFRLGKFRVDKVLKFLAIMAGSSNSVEFVETRRYFCCSSGLALPYTKLFRVFSVVIEVRWFVNALPRMRASEAVGASLNTLCDSCLRGPMAALGYYSVKPMLS